ncbi:dUTP diphosphatase [Candidatus Liberibacter americanus]|uniref:Deoxyuridine 5'-triphosphate nucleotidohydrolase n=1 Tax=Candidatus Liberibacter americanus str. Sao Paulo TaxID=1261131 RepID=U6B878_9HYPH|nr:dUTP diphosphatase [Candidatus Liberibacter americanus]AHA27937.1 dUTPase [Candidatus Liberibacter americanus str. Sao Paulo]EMS35834.1 deoxyuridine 5 27-triphosphate nucleotidohydrolase [Candidatus Liberibacter americanus PW_SP]
MIDYINISLVRLPHADDLPLPEYKTSGAAGMDLFAALPGNEPMILLQGMRSLVPCGYLIAIPSGYEGQVRPRSGLALSNGITCLNSPGTIDSDYRGEIKVLLINLGQEDFIIKRGMRIAQLVISSFVKAIPQVVPDISLEKTDRDDRGFGSSGLY